MRGLFGKPFSKILRPFKSFLNLFLFGVGLKSSRGKSPSVNYDTEPVKEEKKKAKANRSALFATEGGIEGQELTSGQTKRRDTILGN